jgi:hypothetical protein
VSKSTQQRAEFASFIATSTLYMTLSPAQLIGTVGYIASELKNARTPQQIKAASSPLVDLYSFGVTMLEVLFPAVVSTWDRRILW